MTPQELVARLEARKAEMFSDDNTWSSSGSPWSESAASEEFGWEKAITEILRLLEAGETIAPGAHIHRWRLVRQLTLGDRVLEREERCELCRETK